jgi:hypothetical protein
MNLPASTKSGHFRKVGRKWVELTEEEAALDGAQRMSKALDTSVRHLDYLPRNVPDVLDRVRSHELQVPTIEEWRRVIGFAVAAILHLEEVVERNGEQIAALLTGEGYSVNERTPGVYVVAIDGHPICTFDLAGQPWYLPHRPDRRPQDGEVVTSLPGREPPAA